MSIERSHGKPRSTRPRLRSVRLPASAGGEPQRDARRPHRAPKRALLAPLHAYVAQQVDGGLGTDATSPAGAAVVQQALTLYRSARQELFAHSPIVVSCVLRWAIQTALGQHLTLEAAAAGPSSELGQRLLDRAGVCESRAERSIVTAVGLSNALAGKRGTTDPDIAAMMLRGRQAAGGSMRVQHRVKPDGFNLCMRWMRRRALRSVPPPKPTAATRSRRSAATMVVPGRTRPNALGEPLAQLDAPTPLGAPAAAALIITAHNPRKPSSSSDQRTAVNPQPPPSRRIEA
jgi:hypothetical protein